VRDLVAVPADPGHLIPALRAALDGTGPAVLPLEGAAPEGLPARVPLPVALVVRTSGSSGAPKSVAVSAGALLASAAATESVLGGPGGWVLALPGHYIAGAQVIVRAIAAGGEPHSIADGPFTAAAFAEAVRALPVERRRYSALVPTQVHRLVESAEAGEQGIREALRGLDAVLVGGARIAPALLDRAAAAGLRLVRTYGASETAGGCVYDGVPLAGVEVRVVDGEVQLSGPVLAEGYLGDPERTEERFLAEPGRRWYRTGDAGSWEGGRLQIAGRLDDVLITGGEKVSLGLVEQAVQALPGLGEAVVVRAEDPEWGEVPVVVTTAEVDLAVVRAAITDRLGRAAAPRRVLRVAALPLLASGKVDRLRLAALAAPNGERGGSAPPA
jgi:O-succinylbenzoic acid--CoA ligase